MTVVPLREIPAVEDTVLEMLEYIRTKTEKGEIGQIMVITLNREGLPDWWHSEIYNISTLIGALERAKMSLIRLTENG